MLDGRRPMPRPIHIMISRVTKKLIQQSVYDAVFRKKKHWLGDTSASTYNDSDVSVNGDEDSDVETRRVERNRTSVASGIGMPDPPSLIIEPDNDHFTQSQGNENDIDSMARDLPGDLPNETAHLPELDVIQCKPDCTLAAVKSAGNLTLQTNSGIHESSASTSKGSFSDSTIIVGQASLDLPGVPLGLQLELHIQDMDVLYFLSDGKPVDDFYKACFFRLLHRTAEIENKVDFRKTS